MLFTTSWDDGYKLDMKLSALLENYGAKGTFYVCPMRQHQTQMLSADNIRELASRHEVGAHTLTHPHLTKLQPALCTQEIEGSKVWIEQILGRECDMFCYPYGDENPSVRTLVQRAGFKGARTTDGLEFSINDPFAIPATLQVIPFPQRKTWSRWWHPIDPFGPLRVRFFKLRKLDVPIGAMRSWLELAMHLFDGALKRNEPFFHLWGHSREIERFHMWRDLDRFLAHVRASGVRCVTNSELLR